MKEELLKLPIEELRKILKETIEKAELKPPTIKTSTSGS